MSLFTTPIEIRLTPVEIEIVTREVNGPGGAQRLLRTILRDMSPDGSVSLEDVTLQKVHRYAWAYGPGGFENRFRAIENAAGRAGWESPALRHA